MTTFINQPMKEYMKVLTERVGKIKKKNASDFTPEVMKYFNKRAKNGNYYAYDKYGIIVRKDVGANVKSPFGWKRNEDNEIVSIHLRTDCPEDIIKKETLIYIQSRFASQWNNKSNILRKIYDRYMDGDDNDEAVEQTQRKTKVKKTQ